MIEKIFIALIKTYRAVSGVFPRRCRFEPTCSQYMIDAVRAQGLIAGFYLGCRRILRCHPFSPGGYDPVMKPANNKGKVTEEVR